MSDKEEKSCEHVLELHPGTEGEIELRYGMDERTNLIVALEAVDPGAGTAELVLDDMWSGYQMRQFAPDTGRWKPVWPGEDGDVHAIVLGGAGAASVAAQLARYGADVVLVVEHPALERGNAEVFSATVAARLRTGGYRAAVFPASAQGRSRAAPKRPAASRSIPPAKPSGSCSPSACV